MDFFFLQGWWAQWEEINKNVGSAVTADVNLGTGILIEFFIRKKAALQQFVVNINMLIFHFPPSSQLIFTDGNSIWLHFKYICHKNQYQNQSVNTQHAEAGAGAPSSCSNLWVVSISTALSIFNAVEWTVS